MLRSFNALIGRQFDVNEQATATFSDLWFDNQTGKILHLVADLGGWLQSDHVLISPERVARCPSDSADGLLRLSATDIDSAPRWPDTRTTAFSSWPPVIVGPFGSVFSAPLAVAQLQSASGAGYPTEVNTAAPAITAQLTSVKDLLETPVFARDAELGTVTDIGIETDNWHVSSLHVLSEAPADPVVVPWARVRHCGEKSGHIVIAGLQDDHAHTPKSVA
ncbi:PRC-barrel domain-containing protein [Cognatishimia sp. F0-27]|uniref:PRC-barrel domain-containing protein n=1 Tax=Cognatishimia sp. F0-27 TaxID=2816855 RepID=UPI001D0CBD8E|nr:PRC-barrel domain-containing protein [Cognatishimia sp. F0-27]MCC1493883.1 hypothetical protein [Cognatishimia sp. F0-27]